MCAQVADHSRDVWMPLRNSMRKGIHYGNLNNFNILITPGNEVVFIDFENPTLTTTTMTSGWLDSEIHYGLAFPLSQYVFPSLVLPLKGSCSRETAGQRVGRDWSGASAFVLCENT